MFKILQSQKDWLGFQFKKTREICRKSVISYTTSSKAPFFFDPPRKCLSGNWKTRPTRCIRSSREEPPERTPCWSNKTPPEVCWHSPARSCRRVVFPLPLHGGGRALHMMAHTSGSYLLDEYLHPYLLPMTRLRLLAGRSMLMSESRGASVPGG